MKIQKKCLLVAFFSVSLLVVGCGAKLSVKNVSEMTETVAETVVEKVKTEEVAADRTVPDGAVTDGSDQVAGSDETGSQIDVVEAGMIPVYADEINDGVYQVKVDSSSSMFQITACELTVNDGAMSAVMTMSSTGYLKLYMGTGVEAVQAAEADYIPYVETKDGTHTYTVPVAALDMGIDCSAFSKRKEKWYDRVLLFRVDSLPAGAFAEEKITTAESLNLADGSYTAEVALTGGSGRASVESPAVLRVENGQVFATITWGSANYDYMKVNDEKFELIKTEGNSSFEIPVSSFDWRMPVIVDTIAMSEPHEISYTLTFNSATLKKVK